MKAIQCESNNRYYVDETFTGLVSVPASNTSLTQIPIEDILEIALAYVKFQNSEHVPAAAALGVENLYE